MRTRPSTCATGSLGRCSAREKARDENLRKRGKAINERVGLYAAVGKALISARERDGDPYVVIEEAVGWEGFVQSSGEPASTARFHS